MANLEMLRAEELNTATLESLSGGAPFPFPIPGLPGSSSKPTTNPNTVTINQDNGFAGINIAAVLQDIGKLFSL
ncbi:MAG: hypothetical protein RL385_210 [Pseudomonadota bacterium]|jgi:hypothetical protein